MTGCFFAKVKLRSGSKVAIGKACLGKTLVIKMPQESMNEFSKLSALVASKILIMECCEKKCNFCCGELADGIVVIFFESFQGK